MDLRSLVNIRGVEDNPKGKHVNRKIFPFHVNWTKRRCDGCKGTVKYASERSSLANQSFARTMLLSVGRPSILKWLYTTNLLRAFRLTTGRKPPDFFGIVKMLLINPIS